jgi:dihydropteroate synthase
VARASWPVAAADGIGFSGGTGPGDAALWTFGGRSYDLSHHALLIGVLNVTPDSFSDGGRFSEVDPAVAHGLRMAAEGADLIDVGGESTRPGAAPVAVEEELARVVPVVRGLVGAGLAVPVSVDTSKAAVAQAALEAGASVVNDVTGLEGDPEMVPVVAGSACGVVVMHMQGDPRTMQAAPTYRDVVAEVGAYLARRVRELGAAGVAPERVLVDPGIGFGKTLDHNLALLRGIAAIGRATGRPVLVGVSRKSFIGAVIGGGALADREAPTVALTALARALGAGAVRVHDVLPNARALRAAEAVLGAGTAPAPGPDGG